MLSVISFEHFFVYTQIRGAASYMYHTLSLHFGCYPLFTIILLLFAVYSELLTEYTAKSNRMIVYSELLTDYFE
jgi:hypothetical protein